MAEKLAQQSSATSGRLVSRRPDVPSWAPYGWLPVADTDPADGRHRLAFEWADPHVNLIGHSLEETPHGPGFLRCQELFHHRTHTQVLMSVDHPCVIVVAPADAAPGQGGLPGLAAFWLEPLQPIVLSRGTWHWGPYPVASERVSLFNVQGLRYAEDNQRLDLAALGLAVDVDLTPPAD